MPRLNSWLRIPTMSQPFYRAALVETVGLAMFTGVVLPFAGVLARGLGAGPVLLCLLSMAPFFGFLASQLAVHVSDRLAWGRSLALFGAAGNVLVLAFAGVQTAVLFVVLMVAVRIARACRQVLFGSLLRVHLHERTRPPMLKWLRISHMVWGIPIAWIAGQLFDADAHAYRYVFPIAGVVGMLTYWPYVNLPPRGAEERSQTRPERGLTEGVGVFRNDRGFRWFLLTFFVGTLASKIVVPLTPIYFRDVLGLSYADVAMAMGVIGPVLAVFGYLFWGRLLARVNPLNILIACMFLKMARPVLWAFAGTSPMPLALVCVGQGFFRLTVTGIELGSMLTLIGMCEPDRAPVYMSLHYGLIGVRGILGPILGVTLYKLGMSIESIYWLVFAVAFCGGVALLAFRLKQPAVRTATIAA